MALQQLRVAVRDLEKGMFVAKLDRPWIETPFPLQGFYIIDSQDIERLAQYCRYVYVDVEKAHRPASLNQPAQPRPSPRASYGTAPTGQPTPAWITQSDTPSRRSAQKHVKVAPLRIRRGVYRTTTPLRREVRKVARLQAEVGRTMHQVFQSVLEGNRPDMAETRRVTSELVASVLRNPDAMVWLTRVRRLDTYLFDHSIRAATWALVFGRHLGLSAEALEVLALGALLSDIGKIRIPQELLTKETLNGVERQKLHKHVDCATEILRETARIGEDVIAVVAARNERFDGSGYPYGLTGDQIPYLAKVAGISEEYDSLLYPRQATEALAPVDAITDLYNRRNTAFQAELVEEFIKAVGLYPTGTFVELTTREVGVVVEQHGNRRLRPKVLIVLDSNKESLKKMRVVDLADQKRYGGERPVEIAQSLPARAYGLDPWDIHQRGFGGLRSVV